jgi:NADPH:quinone reductase-like Zn-dependent oxidoreductase
MKRFELGNPASIESLRLTNVEPSKPGSGEVLIRVKASSLNFHDYLVATGVLPAAVGRVPLSDGVGEVIEVGRDVARFATGTRVLGTFFPDWLDGSPDAAKVARMRGDQVDGFASEYITLPESAFTEAPPALTDLEAATLPCAGLTAWRALMVEGRLKPGETVLVQGSGGVSVFALQFARMAGATVIACTSTEEKMARLKSLGAAHVLNYRDYPEWGKQVRELTGGRGVDHLVEVAGGDLTQSISASRVGGAIYLVGALSRKPIHFPAGMLINGNVRLIAITVGSQLHQTEMVQAIEQNGLKPLVDRVFPLDELRTAFRYQEDRAHFGKICIAL